jgi:N-acetylglucosamine kinase-like BadF-type ATPase
MSESAGSNIVRSGAEQARTSIHEAVRSACHAAEIQPATLHSACIGVAGAGRPEVSTQIRQILAELLPCSVIVEGDMVIALAGAFGNGPGVVTIAGTGSIAYGRDASGMTARAGGWGFAISDEGSGQWVGRMAVNRALQAFDEGKQSPLLDSLVRAWPATSRDELVILANSTHPDFSKLFPAVLAAADGGDESARAVLFQAGIELANLASRVMRRLSQANEGLPALAMAGGVFRQSALVRQAFYNQVRAEFPTVVVNSTVVEPVLGALELAKTLAAKSVPSGA